MSASFDVKSRTALITGASNGIGRALAIALAQRGANVVLCDIAHSGREVAAEINAGQGGGRALFVHCDVTDPTQLQHAFDTAVRVYGVPTIVANNAGVAEKDYLLDDDRRGWELVVKLNLNAVIEGTRLAAKLMVDNDVEGCIINTASLGGLLPMPFSPIYAATKWGVIGFTRSMKPLALQGVRVAAICPGFTDTPLVRNNMRDNAEFAQVVQATQPEGLIQPSTVVEGILRIIGDGKCAGRCLRITNRSTVYVTFPDELSRRAARGSAGGGSDAPTGDGVSRL